MLTHINEEHNYAQKTTKHSSSVDAISPWTLYKFNNLHWKQEASGWEAEAAEWQLWVQPNLHSMFQARLTCVGTTLCQKLQTVVKDLRLSFSIPEMFPVTFYRKENEVACSE